MPLGHRCSENKAASRRRHGGVSDAEEWHRAPQLLGGEAQDLALIAAAHPYTRPCSLPLTVAKRSRAQTLAQLGETRHASTQLSPNCHE